MMLMGVATNIAGEGVGGNGEDINGRLIGGSKDIGVRVDSRHKMLEIVM